MWVARLKGECDEEDNQGGRGRRPDPRWRQPDDRRLHGRGHARRASSTRLVRQGKKDLTVIANDTARPGVGIGKLIDAQAGRAG